MKIIKFTSRQHRSQKRTMVDKLIDRYKKAGHELKLQFLRNNPAYRPPGMSA
ncbi:hypothetical protein SAMN05192574_102241 [Mucilaginibacter gossypiicola]|uniref:Uncharacterized protein n=1 Tax=Mucilaginibacter gossypiicola TaxID=551995 RepID=A0A1H8D7E7_9SPHI|nr:hypothetical protein SAMN05192574_102241 [Mucilaginibacter gossypiicola]